MFGDKLKEARIEKGLKQSELGALLGLKNTTISNWEKGVSNPDVEVVSKLCSILNVSASYFFEDMASEEIISFNEKQILKKYRALDEHGKNVTDYVLNAEYDRCTEVREHETHYTVMKPNYLTGLSAGTGLYVFDDVPCEQIEVPVEFKDIDFVIGITGDSMEPEYHNGEKVMIKKGEVAIGEVGAFMYEGEAYIKKLGDKQLISLNKNYSSKDIDENTQFEVIGKVVGKLN